MESMSVIDAKRAIFQQLKESGALGSIKSHLRSQLLQTLQRHDQNGALLRDTPPTQPTLHERVLHSLFAEYLKSAGYGFTLSVFQPECGAASDQPVLTRQEIVRILRLDGASPLARFLPEAMAPLADTTHPPAAQPGSREPLALALLRAMSDGLSNASRSDASAQTSSDTAETLSAQLSALEDVHLRRLASDHRQPSMLSLEERMASFRRECEERVRAEVELAVQRVREVEVSAVRMQEAGRYRRALEAERVELDKQHVARLDKLREREERNGDKMKRQQAEIEALAHQHRQRILAEDERIAAERASAERDVQRRAESLDERENRLRKLEDMLASKQSDMERRQVELVRATDDARDTARTEAFHEYAAQREAMRTDRLELERDRARFAEQRESLADELLRGRVLAEKLRACESLRLEAETRVATLSVAEEQLRATVKRLETESREMRESMTSALTKQAELQAAMQQALQPRVDELLAENGTLRRQITELRNKVNKYKEAVRDADRELNDADLRENDLSHEVKRLHKLLTEAVSARDELVNKLEDARLSLTSAQRENTDLRIRLETAIRRHAGLMGGGVTGGVAQLPTSSLPAQPVARTSSSSHQRASPPHTSNPAPLPPFIVGDFALEARLQQIAREEERFKSEMQDFKKRVMDGSTVLEREDILLLRAASSSPERRPSGDFQDQAIVAEAAAQAAVSSVLGKGLDDVLSRIADRVKSSIDQSMAGSVSPRASPPRQQAAGGGGGGGASLGTSKPISPRMRSGPAAAPAPVKESSYGLPVAFGSMAHVHGESGSEASEADESLVPPPTQTISPLRNMRPATAPRSPVATSTTHAPDVSAVHHAPEETFHDETLDMPTLPLETSSYAPRSSLTSSVTSPPRAPSNTPPPVVAPSTESPRSAGSTSSAAAASTLPRSTRTASAPSAGGIPSSRTASVAPVSEEFDFGDYDQMQELDVPGYGEIEEEYLEEEEQASGSGSVF